MVKNPFTSDTFTQVWHKHFNLNKPIFTVGFIKGVRFFKPLHFPFYINIGKNLTKGVSYCNLDNKALGKYKNATFLIYDIPEYEDIKNPDGTLIIKKIKQYPGYLVNLEHYSDYTDFSKKTHSKSSLQKLRRYNNRLENCFNISAKMFTGHIDKAEYDYIFKHFKLLLTRRFNEKQITNNNLHSSEWTFYYEVVFPMILEKKAGLHVVYNNKTPISIRLLYFSETTVFDAITVFDIAYSKFHIGKLSIIKILEWSFENHYKIFNFSKGYFDYKESWSDLKYNFYYHVIYNSKSVMSTLMALPPIYYFKLKQYLRNNNFNSKLHRFNYHLKHNTKKLANHTNYQEMEGNIQTFSKNDLTEIDINNSTNTPLRQAFYNFLFLNKQHCNTCKVYAINKQNLVLITTPNTQIILEPSTG